MKRILVSLALLPCSIWMANPSYALDNSLDEISTDEIRIGCSVSFSRNYKEKKYDTLSNPAFSILAGWHCRDGEEMSIDEYGINGASPGIVAALCWGRKDFVVLVKWEIGSRAADYYGNYYEVFVYTYTSDKNQRTFVRNNAAMKLIPPGWDGRSKAGALVVYPFKNVASIRKKLRRNNIYIH